MTADIDDPLPTNALVEDAFARRPRRRRKKTTDTKGSNSATAETTPPQPSSSEKPLAPEPEPSPQADPPSPPSTASESTPAPDFVEENDSAADKVPVSAEMAVRERTADSTPDTTSSSSHTQEEARPAGDDEGTTEPDLLDLTEEQLEELAEQRLEERETTSPFTVEINGSLKRRLDRLVHRSKVTTGRRLTITAVLFQGLEGNRGRYGKAVADWRASQTPVTSAMLFSQPENRRWLGRSTETTTATITVRPTPQERELIEKAVLVSGAHHRKELVEAVLDSVLPQLPGRPRKF